MLVGIQGDIQGIQGKTISWFQKKGIVVNIFDEILFQGNNTG